MYVGGWGLKATHKRYSNQDLHLVLIIEQCLIRMISSTLDIMITRNAGKIICNLQSAEHLQSGHIHLNKALDPLDPWLCF